MNQLPTFPTEEAGIRIAHRTLYAVRCNLHRLREGEPRSRRLRSFEPQLKELEATLRVVADSYIARRYQAQLNQTWGHNSPGAGARAIAKENMRTLGLIAATAQDMFDDLAQSSAKLVKGVRWNLGEGSNSSSSSMGTTSR